MSFIISTADVVLFLPTLPVLWMIWRCRLERSTRVEIDHADVSHARRGEVGQNRRAEPARADDDDARGLELLLPLEGHLRHDEMAPVATNLFIGKGHILVDLVDAGNETHEPLIME